MKMTRAVRLPQKTDPDDLVYLLKAIGRDRQSIREIDSIVEKNLFVSRRGLAQYHRLLGRRFAKDLSRLKSNQIWLDSGMGAGCAIRDYYRKFPRTAQVIGVCVRFAGDPHEKIQIESRGARVLVGEKIEHRRLQDLGRPQLISDVFGPLTYSQDLRVVLRRYFQVLQIGGVLHTVDAHKLGARSARCLFIDQQRVLTLAEFLKTLKGIEVREQVLGKIVAIRVQKTRTKVPVPRLRYLGQYATRMKVYQVLR